MASPTHFNSTPWTFSILESGIDPETERTRVSNATGLLEQDKRDETLAAVEIATLAIILLAAILGNLFMVVGIWRQLQFRPMSRMYFFMLHLSVADLLVAVFNILPQLLWDITYRFQGTDSLCRAVKYFQVMVLYLSSYILMFMAVDRYKALCCDAFSPWNSLLAAKIMVAAAWVMAIGFAAPQAVIFTLKEIAPGVLDCWGTFIEPWGTKTYVTWFVISIFVVPLLVISTSYGVISYRIWTYTSEPRSWNSSKCQFWKKCSCCPGKHLRQSARSVDDHVVLETAESSPLSQKTTIELNERVKSHVASDRKRQKRNMITDAKIKTLQLTLAVVICFFVCWAPFCVAQLVLVYNPPADLKDVDPVTVILLLLASLNSCTNPWIYLMFSGSLLNQLRVCLGMRLSRPRSNESIGDEPSPKKPPKEDKRLNKRSPQHLADTYGHVLVPYTLTPHDHNQASTNSEEV